MLEDLYTESFEYICFNLNDCTIVKFRQFFINRFIIDHLCLLEVDCIKRIPNRYFALTRTQVVHYSEQGLILVQLLL